MLASLLLDAANVWFFSARISDPPTPPLPLTLCVSISLQQTSVWPSLYGVQDDLSIEEPSAALPPAASLSNLDMPPPYEAVSGGSATQPNAGQRSPTQPNTGQRSPTQLARKLRETKCGYVFLFRLVQSFILKCESGHFYLHGTVTTGRAAPKNSSQ